MSTVSEIQTEYRRAFNTRHGQVVLQDIMGKCFANATTFHLNERQSLINEGRRQIWLHINSILNLTPEQIVRCMQGLPFMPDEE